MKTLKTSFYKKCINEEWYSKMVVWSGLHPSEFVERIRMITRINPYLGLRCAEECNKWEELVPYINRVNSSKLQNIKSANQLISLILVEMKLNGLGNAYKLLIEKGRGIRANNVRTAIDLLARERECDNYIPVFLCAMLKLNIKLFNIAINEIVRCDLHLHETDVNRPYFHSCCGYLSQHRMFSAMSFFLGECNTLQSFFELKNSFCGFAALKYASEKEFIDMTNDYLYQSCIYLLDQYINHKYGRLPQLDQTILTKDVIANTEEIGYFHRLLEEFGEDKSI